MQFRSIKNKTQTVPFREALLRGIAPDGTLYIPVTIPRLGSEFLNTLDRLSLQEMGLRVVSEYIDDIPPHIMQLISERAWNFPIPLRQIDDTLFLLELFHGPTLAFKDIGARFMAECLGYFVREEQKEITIIVATSGDTGSAVAHGFYKVKNISVYLLYPSGKISPLQEKQMTTLGNNIHAVEVNGTFDDCQRLVKMALADRDMVLQHSLTTANSINVGRLLPQITYYISGYAEWRALTGNTTVPVLVVPSGNFGNLTAALYAKKMGIPFGRCIAATNENDVVPEYFRTGVYTPRASKMTYSNAMDVGDPSNLSRILALYDHDMEMMKRDLTAVGINDDETLEEIQDVFDRTGYILDPHTAVGVRSLRKVNPREPAIVVSTAHPAKFPEVIKKALNIDIELPEILKRSLELPKQSVEIDPVYEELKQVLENENI
jgi:threonine synthase